MALNTWKCNHLTSLHFKGLKRQKHTHWRLYVEFYLILCLIQNIVSYIFRHCVIYVITDRELLWVNSDSAVYWECDWVILSVCGSVSFWHVYVLCCYCGKLLSLVANGWVCSLVSYLFCFCLLAICVSIFVLFWFISLCAVSSFFVMSLCSISFTKLGCWLVCFCSCWILRW